MKAKTVAVLTALLMLFCACASPPVPEASLPVYISPEAEDAGVEPDSPVMTEFVFSISRDADATLISAAEYFCGGFTAIMNNTVTARVELSIAPDADLLSGKAQAALLNKKRQLAFSPPLAATATPFLYSSYQNFAMRANASSAMDLLRRSLRGEKNLVPLAAFYQGAQQFLTNFPISNYQSLEYSYFALSDSTNTETALKRLDVDNIVADDNERLEIFFDGRADGLEISLEALSGAELSENLYLTLSYHSIVPVWLVAGGGFFDNLTSAQQAGVLELCADMASLIDDDRVALEKELLDSLTVHGNLSISTDFSNIRNRVFNTLPPLEEAANSQQRLAHELVELMRHI